MCPVVVALSRMLASSLCVVYSTVSFDLCSHGVAVVVVVVVVEVVLRPARSGGPSLGVLALSAALVPSRRRLSGSPRRGCNLDPVVGTTIWTKLHCNSIKGCCSRNFSPKNAMKGHDK